METFLQKVFTNPTIDLSFEDDPGTNAITPSFIVTGVTSRSNERRLRGKASSYPFHPIPACSVPGGTLR